MTRRPTFTFHPASPLAAAAAVHVPWWKLDATDQDEIAKEFGPIFFQVTDWLISFINRMEFFGWVILPGRQGKSPGQALLHGGDLPRLWGLADNFGLALAKPSGAVFDFVKMNWGNTSNYRYRFYNLGWDSEVDVDWQSAQGYYDSHWGWVDGVNEARLSPLAQHQGLFARPLRTSLVFSGENWVKGHHTFEIGFETVLSSRNLMAILEGLYGIRGYDDTKYLPLTADEIEELTRGGGPGLRTIFPGIDLSREKIWHPATQKIGSQVEPQRSLERIAEYQRDRRRYNKKAGVGDTGDDLLLYEITFNPGRTPDAYHTEREAPTQVDWGANDEKFLENFHMRWVCPHVANLVFRDEEMDAPFVKGTMNVFDAPQNQEKIEEVVSAFFWWTCEQIQNAHGLEGVFMSAHRAPSAGRFLRHHFDFSVKEDFYLPEPDRVQRKMFERGTYQGGHQLGIGEIQATKAGYLVRKKGRGSIFWGKPGKTSIIDVP
ncbi:MAG TPA: hypothetical protein EYO59_03335 [Chromatiaceae bacterium]|nr:hypothetical protein [Chromatiaceae bacterium]